MTNMAQGFSKTSSSNNSAAVSDESESELSTRLQGTACIPSNEQQQHTVTTVAHTVTTVARTCTVHTVHCIQFIHTVQLLQKHT